MRVQDDNYLAMLNRLREGKCTDKDVAMLNGSISAEHGIGISKRSYLHHSRSDSEINIMRDLKRSFDPDGIFNPGVIISPSE